MSVCDVPADCAVSGQEPLEQAAEEPAEQQDAEIKAELADGQVLTALTGGDKAADGTDGSKVGPPDSTPELT